MKIKITIIGKTVEKPISALDKPKPIKQSTSSKYSPATEKPDPTLITSEISETF